MAFDLNIMYLLIKIENIAVAIKIVSVTVVFAKNGPNFFIDFVTGHISKWHTLHRNNYVQHYFFHIYTFLPSINFKLVSIVSAIKFYIPLLSLGL